jgi:hypothetical protein
VANKNSVNLRLTREMAALPISRVKSALPVLPAPPALRSQLAKKGGYFLRFLCFFVAILTADYMDFTDLSVLFSASKLWREGFGWGIIEAAYF